MAVKLRLKRMGAIKRPSYRIVATDSRTPRDGSYLEQIGFDTICKIESSLTNYAIKKLKELEIMK